MTNSRRTTYPGIFKHFRLVPQLLPELLQCRELPLSANADMPLSYE